MKKKFIFLTMLLLTLVGGVKFNVLNAQDEEYTCAVSFTLNDSWGDGWNGNNLYVSYGNVTEKMTLQSGKTTTFTLDIPKGSHVVVEYKPEGGYQSENTYTVSYYGGDVICSQYSIANGSSKKDEFDVDCMPSAAAVPTITAEAISDKQIVLTMESAGASSFNIYKGGELFAKGVTGKTYTADNLEPGTNHCFTATAVNLLGETEQSEAACATTYEAGTTIIQIGGNGDATSPSTPIYNYYTSFSITQTIYTQEEIGNGAGLVKSISYKNSAGNNNKRNITVYLKNTSSEYFSTGKTAWESLEDAVCVYQGDFTFGKTDWVEIVVQEDKETFVYEGDNLLVCVIDNTGSSIQPAYADYFNVYSVGTDATDNRCIYGTGNSTSVSSYPIKASSTYQSPIVKFRMTEASASIKASKESIALGDVRLGNYWTEKPVSETVEVKATSTTITSISCDNGFFTLDYDLSKKPVSLVVSYNKNASVSGEQNGNITITSADCDPVVISVTANPYTPAEGDVWELAKEISLEGGYTEKVTGMYDDYILPGEAEDGKAGDAVYKFTLENEGVITASVTGTNGNVAIYKADSISSKRGPSSKNNYNGIVNGPTAPTTFFYDFNDEDLSDFVYSNWTYWNGYVYTSTEGAYIMTKEQYLVTNNSIFSFDIWANDYQYSGSEKYVVFVSEDDVFGNADDIRIKEGNCGNKENINIELSAYSGGKYHFGFFFEKKNFMFSIDNLQLTDGSAKSRTRGAQIENQYPAGTYYLVAAAEGDFTLNLSTSSLPVPGEFAYTAPENNKIAEQTNPELKWESAQYASSYDVYLGTTADALSIKAEDITATSYQTKDLANNTKYYWQIVAKNSVGETEGATWSFVTPLDVPQNVTASSNEIYTENNTNTVTIYWNEIAAAKGYNVYIKVNGQGEGIAHNHNTLITETSYQINNMDYSQNGHIIYVTAVYEIDGEEYESEMSETETVKVTDYITVSGKVTDGTNVIAGATVVATGTDEFGKAQNYTTTTNNDGVYTFNVLVGEYTFTVSKFDYKDKTTETLVLDYQPWTINITLESNPVVEFEVNAEENGDNANVSWTADYTSYNVYRRDSEGNVTKLTQETIAAEQYSDNWSSLPNGEYQYGVSAMVDSPIKVMTEGFDNNNSLPSGWNNPGTYHNYSYRYWSFVDNSARCYGDYTGYTVSLSTSIDLSESSESSLTFDYKNHPYSSYYTAMNTLYVKVKAEGATSWTTVKTISEKVTTYTPCKIDLNNYVGKKIQISFDCYTGQYASTYIDNVVVTGTSLAESKVNWSAPVEKGGIAFTGNGNWNDEANWNRVPSTTDKVVIKGNATITEDVYVTVGSINIASGATLTVKSGAVLNVTNGISNKNAAALVMEDGAQIHQPNANVAATFNMNIVNPTKGWGEGSNNKDGWQFISSPLMNASTSAFATSGDNNDFDLYKYDGTQNLEWVNYKNHKLVGSTFEHNFNDGTLCGWTNLDATNKWTNSTGGIDGTYCLTSSNSGTSYVMSPKVLVEKGSKFYFTAKGTYDQNIVVAVSETGSIDDMATKLTVSIGTSNWQWQDERYVSLDEYDGKEIYIIIKTTAAYNGWATMSIDNLRLTNAGTVSDGTYETEFVNGRGYLASYQAATTAKFVGTLNNATAHEYEVSYTAGEGNELANFHLFGNPFTFNMDWNKVQAEGLVEGYAVVNGNGGYDYLTNGTINVGDGFFVKAIAEDPSLYYNHNARGSRQDVNSINVIATGKAGQDNVVINFAGQKEGFDKLQNFNDEIATVFVANNGRRYGIANVEENVAEVELSFVASQMGNYSISLDVNGEFETVTLVDRFTGIETNMLLEDEYNFTATSNDSQNRFVIRLANGQEPTANSQFVYQSGEELILSIEGSVQIVDMLGRVVYSNEHSNGSNRINVSEFNNAAYFVRDVNEEGVKSQKVVIY